MTIGIIYIGLLAIGVIYALVSGALGWLGDLVGGDIHVDASGHLDAGHFHPISGTTVATFITGFGGGGIVGHYLLRWTLMPGLALATATGLLLAAAAFGVLELIFKQTQAGAEYAVGEVVGREAEVITAIPEQGTGEVAYIARGQREKAPARSADGGAIPRGRPVVIERVMGQTFYVRAGGHEMEAPRPTRG
ncbi:MAG: NfeD family protein [Acidobacteria bacterium]|nr:NfeD family protein [Acidobacteriota bacterium]